MSRLSIQERTNFDQRFHHIRAIDPESVIPTGQRSGHDLSQVRKGGVFSYAGNTYRVTAVATYTETKDDFKPKKNPDVATELTLFCLETAQTHYIEWLRDDELEIYFTERKISRKQLGTHLKYDDGEVVDLDDMDEVAEKEWELFFDGEEFPYDDDGAAMFRSDDGRESHVYSYDFGDEDRGRWLTVEAWTDDPDSDTGTDTDWDYEVYLSITVPPNQIQVMALGEA